jgi:polyisoprenoid-binding protein YceI
MKRFQSMNIRTGHALRRTAMQGLAMIMWPLAAAQAATPVAPTVPKAAVAAPMASVVAAGSQVQFTAKQLGVPLEGQFKRFDAQIALDPRQPQSGKVRMAIELGSVDLNPESDAELIKPEWFGTARFPKATFESATIKAVGPGRFEVLGRMVIKGVGRDMSVPVSLSNAGGQTTATGSFTLKRLDFKIGDGDWADTSVVANEVQVRFKLLLKGLPPL